MPTRLYRAGVPGAGKPGIQATVMGVLADGARGVVADAGTGDPATAVTAKRVAAPSTVKRRPFRMPCIAPSPDRSSTGS